MLLRLLLLLLRLLLRLLLLLGHVADLVCKGKGGELPIERDDKAGGGLAIHHSERVELFVHLVLQLRVVVLEEVRDGLVVSADDVLGCFDVAVRQQAVVEQRFPFQEEEKSEEKI